MKRKAALTVGILAVVAAVLWLRRGTALPPGDAAPVSGTSSPVRERAPQVAVPTTTPVGARPAPAPARTLLGRWLAYLIPDRPLSDEEKTELAALEAEILALGEAAAPTLIERLDGVADTPGTRDRLFNLLRQLPGAAVEDRLMQEARAGTQPSLRTMAIETLGTRRSERSLAALADVARTDPELPGKPLIPGPRDPSDPSTELPDEQTFTPRMQAMAALAATRDPRALAVLVDVARSGPDESLRMEAARHLRELRDVPRAAEALRAAAASDGSAYVRLAALHSLDGADDPALVPLLERLIARDPDAGVRTLAQTILVKLRR